MDRLAWLPLACVIGAQLAGCRGTESAPPVTVVDSAGIAIVHSREPSWGSGEEWMISSEPRLRIGSVEGADPYRLFRVLDATVLSDGRIAVANAGTDEVRFFSPSGTHLGTVGGAGRGPGELRSPRQLVQIDGDSILVVDLDRLSVFDSLGDFAYARTYVGGTPQGWFSDASYLVSIFARGVNPGELGAVRPRMALVRRYRTGPEADTIADVPGSDEYRIQVGRGISNYRQPLGRIRSSIVVHDAIVTGDGTEFELTVLNQSGETVRIIRREADQALTPADVDRFRDAFLAEAPNEELLQRRRQFLRDAPFPDRLPAFDRLLGDPDGNIWARHYRIADDPQEWTVFDPSGRWLGVVRSPDGLEILEIGRDYVLGTVQDALEVEYVQVHDLLK